MTPEDLMKRIDTDISVWLVYLRDMELKAFKVWSVANAKLKDDPTSERWLAVKEKSGATFDKVSRYKNALKRAAETMRRA